MAQKIYALLAGIDKYHPESRVNNLSGCVNDIEAIEEYLQKRIATEKKWELVENSEVPWKLTNELATRQAIIDGFQKHLSQATSEDVVLFYYAGHGSFEPAPEAFRIKDSDRQIETLVCYDSRTTQGRDLADKELSYLIEQVAKNNPHILIVLDCCHSGTATRDPKVVERQTSADGRVRDLKEFIFTEEWLKRRLSENYEPPRHVAIAACRSHQTAKEHRGEDGKRRGAFSYFFTQALQRTHGSLSYADLLQDINALILSKVNDQSPQIEALAEDLGQTFLGGAVGDRLNYFTLTYNTQVYSNWVINGGALHGIRPVTEGETVLAIFPQETPLEQLSDISLSIGQAVVTEVLTEVSKIEFNSITEIDPEAPYRAVVISVPVPQLKVNFVGDAQGIELARRSLTTVNEGEPSLFIKEAEQSEDANYELEAHQGQYWIKQASDRKSIVAPIPLVPDTQGYTLQRAVQIIKRLEHVARWTNVLELKTPPTSQIQPEDVDLEAIVISDGQEYSSKQAISDLRGEYSFNNNQPTPPKVKITVTNHSDQDIYFQIVDLAGDYSISIPPFFPETSSLRLSKKSSDDSLLPSKTSKILDLAIPRAYINSGVTEYNDIFKLIVSTRDFNASLLAQKGLDTPPPTRSTRSTGLSGALNRLMDNISSRNAVEPGSDNLDNWMTKEVKLTIVKPPSGVEIKQSEPTTLQPGVVLHNNSSFQGKVEINSLPPNSRDVNSNLLPPILIEAPNLFQPFEFNTTRSGLSKLSVLEITGVQNHESVTPENPIKIVVDKPLSSNEYVLPLAYDGEFFLPLGTAKAANGKTEITLERLPEPIANSRSLQGSIKILFQKLLTQPFGQKFSYPLLRLSEILPDGRVSYQADKEIITAKVTQAKKILLYIHGIMGDTETSVASAQQAKLTENGQQKTLRDKYDLILAFDYENLNTTIEENAKLLKQRLEEVGLTANHGKQLDIVAHSMGGLISRTFIEKEGGNKIVQHLVMLGTPNGGSPWSTVQDWAFAALGIGLNQLSSVAWPAVVIAGILKLVDANIKTVEQMSPSSNFIQSIATNPDPNVRYTIIAGDRSIRPEALQTDSGKQSSAIKRLMEKLFGSAQERVVNLVFFQQPNDIAVTLESIKSVSENRIPKPRIIAPDATCDHVTYFTTQSGLDALVKALCEEV
ncbi:peptidase C14 caspase catalytic subunit p20 [Scytonema hofmannii PCC 7110]|uniref:Peptidase C14 caspase catalytic subunit p20 n=1 Tax=Scytonema hofmannii PCC 7110 TaxID=128403 RepID=A0A139X7Y9_9CYAN|nr:caspase family protein [Scytonema hofmannii]KYC40800.1 peptidase C14 caspase catalytic subunit p20 [Scytonema hofmannii PCC 7110]